MFYGSLQNMDMHISIKVSELFLMNDVGCRRKRAVQDAGSVHEWFPEQFWESDQGAAMKVKLALLRFNIKRSTGDTQVISPQLSASTLWPSS